jgi:hypothetical protein
MPKSSRNHHQAGLSTIKSVAILSGIMVLFLIIFLLSSSGNKDKNNNNTDDQTNNSQSGNKESYIRVPANSLVYANDTYGFSFAYPDDFQQLTESTSSINLSLMSAQSRFADKKPIGNTGTVMNGQLGAYVYDKSSFKVAAANPNVVVSPIEKDGKTTWTITTSGSTDPKLFPGQLYSPQTTTSQSGVIVYLFPYYAKSDYATNSYQGHLVFALDNNYVLVSMPFLSKLDDTVLAKQDIAAYNVVLNNIAKTVRTFAGTSSSSDSSTTSDSDSSSSSSSSN